LLPPEMMVRATKKHMPPLGLFTLIHLPR